MHKLLYLIIKARICVHDKSLLWKTECVHLIKVFTTSSETY